MRPALILLLVCANAGCYRWARWHAIKALDDQGEVPRGLDAIVVPGCPTRRDGQVSSCIERRVGAAVGYWRQGYAPRLLFSGASVHTAGVEARAMAAEAARLGVPSESVLVEDAARHTTQNFRYAANILLPRGWRRVLVVTDPFQLPFAQLFARYIGLIAWALPSVALWPRAFMRRAVLLDDVEPIPWISWR